MTDKPKSLLSEKEQEFQAELKKLGVEIEAVIVRSVREWMPSLYVFRFRKKGKWSEAASLPWKGDRTYPDVLKSVRS